MRVANGAQGLIGRLDLIAAATYTPARAHGASGHGCLRFGRSRGATGCHRGCRAQARRRTYHVLARGVPRPAPAPTPAPAPAPTPVGVLGELLGVRAGDEDIDANCAEWALMLRSGSSSWLRSSRRRRLRSVTTQAPPRASLATEEDFGVCPKGSALALAGEISTGSTP